MIGVGRFQDPLTTLLNYGPRLPVTERLLSVVATSHFAAFRTDTLLYQAQDVRPHRNYQPPDTPACKGRQESQK